MKPFLIARIPGYDSHKIAWLWACGISFMPMYVHTVCGHMRMPRDILNNKKESPCFAMYCMVWSSWKQKGFDYVLPCQKCSISAVDSDINHSWKIAYSIDTVDSVWTLSTKKSRCFRILWNEGKRLDPKEGHLASVRRTARNFCRTPPSSASVKQQY